MAAHVIDPEFYEQRPWEDDTVIGALMAVVARLLHPLVGEELETAVRAAMAGFRVYFTKSGLFSKTHSRRHVDSAMATREASKNRLL